MSIENKIRAIAGILILSSIILSKIHHPNWIWATVFVGANLLQSSFTKFCPLEMALRKIEKQ